MEELDDSEMEDLYAWVDQIPLSRPKRNISRDFSDGVLAAEMVKYYMPRLIEIHNYTPANAIKQKMENWYLLNRKVFIKLNFELSEDVIRSISRCEPYTVERVLSMLRVKIDRALWEQQKNSSRNSHLDSASEKPEADQNLGSPGRMRKTGHPVSPHKVSTHSIMKSRIPELSSTVAESDFVPRVTYEEKQQECLAKDETIQILQAKVRRLEHLLHLKDIRIDDLAGRFEKVRPTGGNKGNKR